VIDESVEHFETGFFIDGPTEHIASQNKRGDGNTGTSEYTTLHERDLLVTPTYSVSDLDGIA
jgi:hypothetical protein